MEGTTRSVGGDRRPRTTGPENHGVDGSRPFFFVHIMRTAGGTLREHLYANFARDVRYPDWRVDPPDAYLDIARLRGLDDERRSGIRLYMGHFPYVISQLVGARTLTLLRDPVERTLSMLKARSRKREIGMDLERIYDGLIERYDGLRFKRLAGNHQTKIFAMTPEDRLKNYMDVIEIDEERMEIAKRNIERADVVGFQEDLPAFYAELRERFGWSIGEVDDVHVSPPVEVPQSFRDRIAADVALDSEFYEYARAVASRRR